MNTAQVKSAIDAAIRSTLRGISVSGKAGERVLKGATERALVAAGLGVDVEDTKQFLRAGMPVWRSRDSGEVQLTELRRRIDLVVYESDFPVALLEIESDLDDLRRNVTSRRRGHYDVHSIARSSERRFFDSYKSLERMAAAALYWHHMERTGSYPTPEEGAALLSAITSDSASVHNPASVPLFLVSGRCRPQDPEILDLRLRSLGAVLRCAAMGGG